MSVVERLKEKTSLLEKMQAANLLTDAEREFLANIGIFETEKSRGIRDGDTQ